MEGGGLLLALLGLLAASAILYELARRLGLPYPTVLVVGGLAMALIPGLPAPSLEPDLVLEVFLPPLLFAAAFQSPLRDLREYLTPLLRLSIGLVLLTIATVAIVANALVPPMPLAAAATLGAILAPTDALAASSVFRRLGVPRIIRTLVEGESLFNDATALVAYRFAVAATLTGTFVLGDAAVSFLVAGLGGLAVGLVVGWAGAWVVRLTHDPPVEVAVSLLVPFAAYLPAEDLGFSGVLATVAAGLLIGRRLGAILSADSRLLWLTTWHMVEFVMNGVLFLMLGLELRDILGSLTDEGPAVVAGLIVAIAAVVILTRIVFTAGVSFLPGSPRHQIAKVAPHLAWRASGIVGWSGLRGAVSLAAALALPPEFPERNLILIVTFGVILITLVGQGLTLPAIVRSSDWAATGLDADEAGLARSTAYTAGLQEIERIRPDWSEHAPLLDRLAASLEDQSRHLATEDPDETADRRRERLDHEAIQRSVIDAQRAALADLRDRGEINDITLREVERELDLQELRMEA